MISRQLLEKIKGYHHARQLYLNEVTELQTRLKNKGISSCPTLRLQKRAQYFAASSSSSSTFISGKVAQNNTLKEIDKQT